MKKTDNKTKPNPPNKNKNPDRSRDFLKCGRTNLFRKNRNGFEPRTLPIINRDAQNQQ